ncbi:MAG: DNA repair protein [Thermoproteota archaeon]|nr:DNA repair protein [Thermoproteota archaeon]
MQRLHTSFDPVSSINSGQVFLWEKHNNSWYGIHGDRVIKFTQYEGCFEFCSFPEDKSCDQKIFRLDDDIQKIFKEISHDPLVGRLTRAYPGLRLIRQDPHQCMFSFVCATNTNIPMIRRMLYNLTRKFGKRTKVDGMEFFTFPTAADINRAAVDELRDCGLGYRTKAIKAVADAIISGRLDFDSLKKTNYYESKKELLQIYGIGNKIADCALLFSLEKLDAFPIDVWIARALARHYSWLYTIKFSDKIAPHQYEQLSEVVRRYFGKYAGYAQQYLYYYMRQAAGKKW